jgi:hypothetical protein
MDAPDELNFEEHIEPLFSKRDQEAMLIMFDLWKAEDVRDNADAILEQVESGRMPCYEPWSQDKVELFRRWMESGMAD